MPSKTYNPYKINTESINRFRGVANHENQQTMAKEFVGSSDNAISFRVGELTGRDGQVKEATESALSTGAVHSASSGDVSWVMSTGPDVFVDAVESRFRKLTLFAIRGIPKGIPFDFANDKLCSDLWATNPAFVAYQRTDAASLRAWSTGNPIAFCWDISYGGGGGGSPPKLPELPDPKDFDIPYINPIIPNIPPIDDPEDDSDDGTRCRLSFVGLSSRCVAIATEINTTPDAMSVTLTVKSVGAIAKVSSSSQSPFFSAWHSSVETRVDGLVTQIVSTVTITPTMAHDPYTAGLIGQQLGTYKGRIKLTITVCGKEREIFVAAENIITTKRKAIPEGFAFAGGGYDKTEFWNLSLGEIPSRSRIYISADGTMPVYATDVQRPDGTTGEFGFVGNYLSSIRFVASFGVFPANHRNVAGDISGSINETYPATSPIISPSLDKYLSYYDEESRRVIHPYYGDDVGFAYAGASTPPYYRRILRFMSFSGCYTYATSEDIKKVYGGW